MVVPREPFLLHSERLFAHLAAGLQLPINKILEIGCGPDSPLVPFVRSHFPQASILQIDALEKAVVLARLANHDCQVEQMLASDMSAIPDSSIDLVVGMSVFDQNPARALPVIAKEIHRVLRLEGQVLYLHNEELNLPAQADSFVVENQRLLLPSPRWSPTNDIEYCSGPKAAIESIVSLDPHKYRPLIEYLVGILPQYYATMQKSNVGEVQVPFLSQCGPQRMNHIRSAVRDIETELQVTFEDCRSSQLLFDHLTKSMFSAEQGFDCLVAGMFEQHLQADWRNMFSVKPPTSVFVRGCTRVGYSCLQAPHRKPDYTQLDTFCAEPNESSVSLVGYQFGLLARKSTFDV